MTQANEHGLTAADDQRLRDMVHDWTQALRSRNWARLLALCAPEIQYMPADHPILRGHTELRDWFDAFPPVTELDQPVEWIDGAGGVAVLRARFTATLDVNGQHISNVGKVLCSFRKAPSGQWLATAVCWNWDKAAG